MTIDKKINNINFDFSNIQIAGLSDRNKKFIGEMSDFKIQYLVVMIWKFWGKDTQSIRGRK